MNEQMKLYGKILSLVIFLIIMLGLIWWHTVHVWSDCLEEHSVLTCMRMLGR